MPTPEELNRCRANLGPTLLIKRDDQTGLALAATGGKLEFLVGQALEQGADTLVTVGGAQSNHCRQTAAAAAKAGLTCELILNGRKPDVPNGNLLLDQLLGAKEHWIERPQRPVKLRELPEQLRAQGRKPYVIPVGGSNGVGATGYVGGDDRTGGAISREQAARGPRRIRFKFRRDTGRDRVGRAHYRFRRANCTVCPLIRTNPNSTNTRKRSRRSPTSARNTSVRTCGWRQKTSRWFTATWAKATAW
jgi:hypothetical protein